ncbi:carboxylesterase/lipase family protein [Streptomyces sp. NPDC091294]|uniref:carboxylesterase/lipase family protein n=1 Tax=Streptomyces sp. NPDC091294 TaxID=3365992 RepID=UPI0037FC5131
MFPRSDRTTNWKQGLVALAVALLVPATLLGATAASDGLTDVSNAPGRSRPAPVVGTDNGTLRGVAAPAADQFLGIPYAEPPVRELRFAPPARPADWKGVRTADRQSPACIQFEPTGVREEQAVSEDCLYLDVHRPARAAKKARLPVMVWFHGGANTQGSGVLYGGSSMVATTDTIVVSVNYRLGALGFLAHPALSAETPEGSGNYARMDQRASLQWVQRNIAAFGGDPGNVTVYGQSAGGGAVCNLLAMPSARDLFHRAIVQSSDCMANPTSLSAGEQSGVRFAQAVGCTDPDTAVTCLRKAWPGTLVAHQGDYLGGAKTGSGLLPKSFAQALADGTWNKVPLITGNTRSENRLTAAYTGITAEGYAAEVRRLYGERADQVLKLYPLRDFKSPWDAITQLQTDASRACPSTRTTRTIAASGTVYRYEFNDPTSPTLYGFRVPGEDMSNAHSAELAYLFDFTLGERPLTAQQEKLSRQMMRYWGAFAHHGDPNIKGQPTWPRFDSAERVMQLRARGASEVITDYAADHRCDYWLT